MNDPTGDMLKHLERDAQGPTLQDGYLYMRLDGRGFSKLTRQAHKPFDTRLATAMINTTTSLVRAFHADIGYTQSDEISLVWKPRVGEDSWFFSGRRDKWLSVLAAKTSALFLVECLRADLTWMLDEAAHFDARLVDGLDAQTSAQFLAWRAEDARRNAIQMCAQARFNKKSLTGQNLGVLRRRLEDNGTPFDNEPNALKNGTLIYTQMRDLSPERRAAIPEAFRPDASQPILRPHIVTDDTRLLSRLENLEDILFQTQDA